MLNDYFNKNADSLKKKKLWLFDLDGTIYSSNDLFDGSLKLLNRIKETGNEYVFITNNSSNSIEVLLNKVHKMGIQAVSDNFFTALDCTIALIKEKYINKKLYIQGTKAFLEQFDSEGIKYTTEVEGDIDVCLIGYDTEYTFEKVCKTCQVLFKNPNCIYLATNPDLCCPVSWGFQPDCGTIAYSIECATKRKPIYIGKPAATMVEVAMKKFNVSKDECVVVGDRLYTDIASGINAGTDTVVVFTGECQANDIQDSEYKPTFAFSSVKDIII